ncbi:MAG: Gfo/Idh/MocA family oxidoreductase [Ruminococcaceae bacterium]|nr:Gfo/Idh/MocA family oxidoreductase [Oscillospiraceae bacterium]
MKKLRVGVFGAGRGADLATNFMMLGCEIVAVCDLHKERREEAAKKLGGIAAYEDFDSFIEHGMDAVILANYFHEHAPYAIKCFEKGIHVFGECISNGTMAEGVELVRAFEKSNCVYMLAENYPQMIFNREMKRVCDSGTLGKIMYAEGEYNHPGDPNDVWFNKTYNYFEKHWRNYLPRTYYITHSLGPVMRATGATPKTVSALASFAPIVGDYPTARYVGDRAAIIMTQNDDGSVFRITGCAAFGAHHNAYRICGTKGQIENLRGMGSKVMLRYNSWEKPEGANEVELYEPKWNDKDEDLIVKSGHGGGDYLTARMFVECINEGKQPEHPFDIYSAVNMSSVAILAHRSVLEGGKPYDIPDFREEKWCKMYENDRLTPFYGTDGSEPTLPCCSVTDFKPTEDQVRRYREQLGIE